MDNTYSNRIHESTVTEVGVRPLSTVLRTLEILTFFGQQTRPQRLAEVANATGLSRATAYQRLLTLVAAGWLEQDAAGAYRLSMLPARLASAAMDQADFGARAEPVLAQLVWLVNETASLSVLDRGLPCIVARVESDSLLRADQKIGTPMALDGSASGRVLAAYADELTLQRLREGAHPLASDDILQETRAKGYALSSGYTHKGVRAVAAPVFDLRGFCVATLSIVVPETRFELERFRQPVLNSAAELTRILQGKSQ